MTVGPLGSASVTLNASGGGTVSMGPSVYGAEWRVTRMVTSLTKGTGTLTVYQDTVTPGSQLDYTVTPEGDTSETDFTLSAPSQVVGVYASGTPGAVGTLILYGEASR